MIRMTVKDVLAIPSLQHDEARYTLLLWEGAHLKRELALVGAEALKEYEDYPVSYFHLNTETGASVIEATGP